MMVLNDLTVVDDALKAWHGEHADGKGHRQQGAKMYFVRLEMAHLFEGFRIVKKIRDTPALLDSVERCDRQTQESFQAVCEFVDSPDYNKMERIRHNITFHYDEGSVRKALDALGERMPDRPMPLSLGRETVDWYFQPADLIIDRIVVRQIGQIPYELDAREETDALVVRIQKHLMLFADFAGYFIRHYTRK